MLTRLLIATVCGCGMMLLPLNAGEGGSNVEQLKASLATWQKAKESHSGNYAYTVRFISFTGAGTDTEIVVHDNKVMERRYRVRSGRPLPVPPGKEAAEEKWTWIEKGKDLGKAKEGATAKTIDELYEEAAKILTRKLESTERLTLTFDKAGLLQNCFVVDTRIADDAPKHGVVITELKLEERKKK